MVPYDMFGDVGHALGCWKSELVHSFSIFSLDVSYKIFFNKASYVLKYKRIFKQQFIKNIISQIIV